MTSTRSIDLHRHRLAAARETGGRANGEAGQHERRQHETPPHARPRDLEAVSIAIDTGLVIKAEAIDPGISYATRLMTFTDTGNLTDLAGHHVEAPGPLAALRRLVDEERNTDGLTPGEARDFHDKITRLTRDTLDTGEGHVAAPELGLATYNTCLETELTERLDVRLTKAIDRLPPRIPAESPEVRWHDTVTAAAGPAVVEDARWPALAASLDRAAMTGWDWATHLPQLARTPPLPDRQPADELYYRVLNAHPNAAPTPPADGNASPRRGVALPARH